MIEKKESKTVCESEAQGNCWIVVPLTEVEKPGEGVDLGQEMKCSVSGMQLLRYLSIQAEMSRSQLDLSIWSSEERFGLKS